ncbi:nodulation protein NfeD [Membranicola marinus]|uniref:Nodulation protein NfeD n=1 Tax=Membranihabitans marinus TaxID=1227546 RepID=A0A953LD57_9BACT|nr:nodulation protein NfeD [Membranihabitans marinus]MBY5958499.1 nodulation protein NfeD [Membranihabitans marinus]
MKHLFIFLFSVTLVLCSFAQPDSAFSQNKEVTLINVNGAISPTTTNYIKRGITKARESGSVALIIEMDTPGGLLESTKNIVQAILDSDDLPIVVYIAPEGASAASAGTFITMAAHIAAMAPATNIGAASPVQMGPSGSSQPDTVMQKKIFNYTESYIESIANRRGRNADWAISAVRDGKSITADKAVELNVVDMIASSRQDLLEKINGKTVAGKTLETRSAEIVILKPNLMESLLGFAMRPEVMLILTMVAIYGIIGEITNPGAIIPGVSGVIALILLLFASAAMPINMAGFLLIGLAIALFIAEAFTPTFGLLIAGGAVSFFLGALMLFQDLPEPMSISLGWLIPATVLTALFFIWVAAEGIRAQFRESKTGKEAMIGKKAEVVDRIDQTGGRVLLFGEYWNAVSEDTLEVGMKCEVISIHNLQLTVKKINPETT